MSLHSLAAADDAAGLRAALADDPAAVDAYERHPALGEVIYRHGLKGTPLHIAALQGSLEAIRVLLDFGADPGLPVMQFERGFDPVPDSSAIDLARRVGRQDAAALLTVGPAVEVAELGAKAC